MHTHVENFSRNKKFQVWKRWVDNKSANGVKRLNTVVKSILLRRTKEDLKNIGELRELPVKNIIPIYIKLDEEEQKVLFTHFYYYHLSKSTHDWYLILGLSHGFKFFEITTRGFYYASSKEKWFR